MFLPPQRKFIRKVHRPIISSFAKLNTFNPGIYTLRGLGCSFLTAKLLETARRKLTRKFKNKRTTIPKTVVRNFTFSPIAPNFGIIKKKIGMRMGKGKGAISSYVFPLRVNKPLFNYRCLIAGFRIKKIARKLRYRFPIKTQILTNKVKIKKIIFERKLASFEWGTKTLIKKKLAE